MVDVMASYRHPERRGRTIQSIAAWRVRLPRGWRSIIVINLDEDAVG